MVWQKAVEKKYKSAADGCAFILWPKGRRQSSLSLPSIRNDRKKQLYNQKRLGEPLYTITKNIDRPGSYAYNRNVQFIAAVRIGI